jgi:Ca-activated chloride channel family protein
VPSFQWPWVLPALLLLPLLAWRSRTRRAAHPAIAFPQAGALTRLPRSRRQSWMQLPALLRTLALAVLIVALARPQWGARRVRNISRSIGIQVVIDRSGSMSATDVMYQGRRRSRLDVVKRVSDEFIFGDGADLPGRPSDMVGLIAFGVFPSTLCPLTLAHEHLRPVLYAVNVAGGIENGTAIGDALALAAARFEATETAAGGQFKSKAIVLLTDGENNSGARSVADAALLARQWGVRVYAIAIRPLAARDEYDEMVQYDLHALAAQTGGAAYTVRDGSELHAIYRRIDQLERSEVQVSRLVEGRDGIFALAGTGLALLLGELVLAQTWLRRAP